VKIELEAQIHIHHQSDDALLVHLTNRLKASARLLAEAIAANSPVESMPQPFSEVSAMNPILQQLADQVAASVTIETSAVTLINGIADRISKAVSDALAGGATAQQLADAVNAEVSSMKTSSAALAAAVAANTPATP
jgi:hypothetical protein